jgi:hypothetical protein
VYCIRSDEPTLPTTAAPLWMAEPGVKQRQVLPPHFLIQPLRGSATAESGQAGIRGYGQGLPTAHSTSPLRHPQ